MNTNPETLYEGKAKIITAVDGKPNVVRQTFKDSLTAFNGQKKGSFQGKGRINRDISDLLFQYLSQQGIDHHWIESEGESSCLTHKLKIIPLEVVTRNVVAGSLSKRLGLSEGVQLSEPVVEFYFKNDDLGDPLLTEDHIHVLRLASSEELMFIKKQALIINDLLVKLFKKCELQLVDFKLEFGKADHKILLADEITPDTCRLWDIKTQERFDKDRFRRDLGKVEESYLEVLGRIKKALGK